MSDPATRILSVLRREPGLSDGPILGLLTGEDHQHTGALGFTLDAMRRDPDEPSPGPRCLAVIEPWLARAPRRNWEWMVRSHPSAWLELRGAWLSAAADRRAEPLSPDPSVGTGLHAEALGAERLARRASAGQLTRAELPGPEDLPTSPSALGAVLVAWGHLEPDRALELASLMTEKVEVHSIAPAVRRVCELAATAGAAGRLVELAHRRDLIVDDAFWLAMAAHARAAPPGELEALLIERIPRVVDELDPGDELMAGEFLIDAALTLRREELVEPSVEAWGLPPWHLIARIVDRSHRGQGRGLLDRSLNLAHDLYSRHAMGSPSWWLDARHSGQPSACCHAVLDLVDAGFSAPLPCRSTELWTGAPSP